MVHHILTTNSLLFKTRSVISPLCTLCNSERETITHILWECQEVQKLLLSFEILLDSLTIPFTFNKDSFLFGFLRQREGYRNTDNEILLIIKQYIYRIRCQHNSLSLHALLNAIRDNYSVQLCIANSKGEDFREKLEAKWGKWSRLFDFMSS